MGHSLQKIRVTGLRPHYEVFMREVHRLGILEVTENTEFIRESDKIFAGDTQQGLDPAHIENALKFLSSKKAKNGKITLTEKEAENRFQAFSPLAGNIVSECEVMRLELAKLKEERADIQQKMSFLIPFRTFKTPLAETFSTEKTRTWVGSLAKTQREKFIIVLSQKSNLVDVQPCGETEKKVFLRVTVAEEIGDLIKDEFRFFGFEEVRFGKEFSEYYGQKPREVLYLLEKIEHECGQKIRFLEERKAELVQHTEDLQIFLEYSLWQEKEQDLQKKMLRSPYLFAFEAWGKGADIAALQEWARRAFDGEVEVASVPTREKEKAPFFVHNAFWTAFLALLSNLLLGYKKHKFQPFMRSPKYVSFRNV